MITENFKTKLKQLPKKPGVYIFRNSKGRIIYIGKALSLKDRVGSYFRQKHKDQKTIELVNNIANFEFNIVNSEFEALLLEARLIKQHLPKYNLALKDGKSYLYIVIAKQFPNRVSLARWTELNQNLLDWYGPFPTAGDARRILKIVRRIFPFRSCKRLPRSTCLYEHLKLCPAPCAITPSPKPLFNSPLEERENIMPVFNNKSSVPPFLKPACRQGRGGIKGGFLEDDYKKTILRIRKLLSGKTNPLKQLIKSFATEMRSAAKDLDFEKAQSIKAQIDSLTSLTAGWRSVPIEKQEFSSAIQELRKILVKCQGYDPMTINKIEGFDVSNLGDEIIVGSMVAFINGERDNSLYRKFNLKFNQLEQDDPEGIKNLVSRRLNHQEWIYPQLILVDGGKTQVGAAFAAIKEKGLTGQISLLGLAKEEEVIVIPRIEKEKIIDWKMLHLSRHDKILQLLQSVRDESHRFAKKYYLTVGLKYN